MSYLKSQVLLLACMVSLLPLIACAPTPSTTITPSASSTMSPEPLPVPTLAPTTPPPIPTPVPTSTPNPTTEDASLMTPIGLKAVDVQINSLLLTWEASDDADHYRVYLNDELLADDVMGTAYQVKDLKSGSRYVFSLSSIKSPDKESPRSKSVSVNFF